MPVDGDDGTIVADALCDGEGNAVWVELEGVVMTVCKEWGADKTRTDVVEVDVSDASDVAKLGEAFEVMVDVAFGGRVGRSGTQASCAGNAADDGEVAVLFGVLLEVVEGCTYHLCETRHVGGNGCHLFSHVEGGVLIADAGTVEVEVHAACLPNEGEEAFGSILLRDVDALGGDHIEVLALNLLQQCLPPSGDAHLPTLRGEYLDHFESDA